MKSLVREILSLRTPAIDRYYQPEYETHISGEGNERRNPAINESPPFQLSRVGCNGHNIVEGIAEYVIFESDLYDPDEPHGGNPQTEEQMVENDRRLAGRVEINRSTGGGGRHYRVWITHPDGSPVACPDRTTYNSLCRYVCDELGMTNKTCAKSGYLWVWSANHNGCSFEYISGQTEPFIIPDDWEPPVRTLRSRNREVTLTGRHEHILSEIDEAGFLVIQKEFEDGTEYFATHTCGLKAAHRSLKLRGWFDTISPGTQPTEPNCYILPFPEGFQVFRFGTTDEPGWNKRQSDSRSWVWYDQFEESDWRSLCVRFQGSPKAGASKQCFTFQEAVDATAAITAAGGDIDVPYGPVTVELSEGFITCSIPNTHDLTEGWADGSRYTKTCVIDPTKCRGAIMPEFACVAFHWNEHSEQTGETMFFVRYSDGTWKPEALNNWRASLKGHGLTKPMIEEFYNVGCQEPRRIVSRPFQKYDSPLYWNRGVQFACDPVPGEHPTWDAVIKHTGEYLNPYVAENPWCQEHGIRTGYDFLICYLAMTVQHPERRLPQLFLYSAPQGTGKDTFPDACALLFTEGAVVDATQAVTSEAAFSFELLGTLFYKLNEVDLSRSGSTAESRVRQWVTGHTLTIHKKGATPFEATNYGRVIQMANDLSYKMVDADDERVIVIELEPIPEKLDWATELEPALIDERSAFLHTLLNYYLPEKGARGSRCYLPILMTSVKRQSILASLQQLSPEDDQRLQLILKLHEQGWTGLKQFDDLPNELTSGLKPHTFQYAWNRIAKHMKSLGLNPIQRECIRHQQRSAWGFDTRASS